MRRSGKTTRHVNDAIEALFKYREIIVPIENDYCVVSEWESLKSSMKPEQVIVDEDAMLLPGHNNGMTNNVQRELLHRIMKRLRSEHYWIFTGKHLIISGGNKNVLRLSV